MPTPKHRINLSVPENVDRALQRLAERDNTSLSGKAVELLKRALETEEDEALLQIARERDNEKEAFVSHQDAWG